MVKRSSSDLGLAYVRQVALLRKRAGLLRIEVLKLAGLTTSSLALLDVAGAVVCLPVRPARGWIQLVVFLASSGHRLRFHAAEVHLPFDLRVEHCVGKGCLP